MTRDEYKRALEAEFPGAYQRIDDMMRDYDHQHAGQAPAAADPAPAAPADEPEPEQD